jgi:hypothetical protein
MSDAIGPSPIGLHGVYRDSFYLPWNDLKEASFLSHKGVQILTGAVGTKSQILQRIKFVQREYVLLNLQSNREHRVNGMIQ